MSIITLTAYVLTVSGLLNLNIANGKSLHGYSASNKRKSSENVNSGAPLSQFQPLSEDWLKSLQGEDFLEVETDGGLSGNSQSSFNSRAETTTASNLGFDFRYLFHNDKEHKKPSTNSGWDKSQTGNQNQNNEQKPSLHQDSRNDDHNLPDFDFNNQGPFQSNAPQFDPFNFPFQQVPNFLNLGRPGYSRSRGPSPIWGGHGYSNRINFPLPPLFVRGFGGY